MNTQMIKMMVVTAAMMMAACATVSGGTTETLKVSALKNNQAAVAICTVKYKNGVATVTTPAAVVVNRSRDPVNVACTSDGYRGEADVPSAYRSATMETTTLLFGGVGRRIEESSGAAYVYPEDIVVTLFPLETVEISGNSQIVK